MKPQSKSLSSLADEPPAIDVRGITEDIKRMRRNPRLRGLAWGGRVVGRRKSE